MGHYAWDCTLFKFARNLRHVLQQLDFGQHYGNFLQEEQNTSDLQKKHDLQALFCSHCGAYSFLLWMPLKKHSKDKNNTDMQFTMFDVFHPIISFFLSLES